MSVPFEAIWIRRSVGLAAFTCLLYDSILTFDDEVRHIWRARPSATKYLFLANRYGTLLGQMIVQLEETGIMSRNSQQFCKHFSIFGAFLFNLSGESIHILVLLRAWAIWRCERRVAGVLIGVYVVYFMIMLGVAIFGSRNPAFQEYMYFDDVGICVGIAPPYVWTMSVASFVLDTIVFAITMWSLMQYSRNGRCLYPTQLIHRLIRDASMFYATGVFCNFLMVICFIVYASDPRNFFSLSVASPLLAMVGQRLVLNLRGLEVRSYSPRSISAEVDRQMDALKQANPEFWKSGSVGGGNSVGNVAEENVDEGLERDLSRLGMVAGEGEGEGEDEDEIVVGMRDALAEYADAFELEDVREERWTPLALDETHARNFERGSTED